MPLTAPAPSSFDTYLVDANRTSLLTHADERELAARVRSGDPIARDQLVRANMRLVVNIARGFRGKGVSIEDLVAEGNLGLLRAVEGYDPDMNTRFSTYAAYWISQSMRRGVINTARTIRVPAYLSVLLGQWGRASQALAEELGRPATREEIAARLGLKPKQARMVADAIRVGRTQSTGVDEDDAIGSTETVADWRADAPGDAMQAAADLNRLSELLGRLDQREAMVLRLRYGIGGAEPMTLKDIGAHLGLTRERVRQIESAALAQLGEDFDPTS
ncbi:sigma-70 family RNA polymerase sigma factor [Limnoglobus roseus]|uniref:RNA polymerase sigma factor n=1 Tax=Limnoglobus roseus TaxID=2598579 RepID=A0A5C1ANA1_9BACT|nr:RNA polymerase sigma factor RpoD/SigA [Limnoglobus roseus]QEL18398.1 RNA polymerase sigma factor [Limnoglobus roseus]